MSKFQFRKVIKDVEGGQASYPMSEEVEFDTIGLYETNEDGTQSFIDELTEEEMTSFRAQDDFEEVLNKIK